MKKSINYEEFKINERYHVNQDVKHLERDINYSEFLIDDRVEKRESKISELLKNNYE